MLQSLTMDSHVHISFKNSARETKRLVDNAMLKKISIAAIAYHGSIRRFNDFLENPGLKACAITGLGEKGNESAAKIKYIGGHIYLIRGQQIDTKEGDLIGWPVKEQINPNGKDLEMICRDFKAQGAIRVLPHPERYYEDHLADLIRSGHIDAVEYNCSPKVIIYLFMKGSNELAKRFSKGYDVPLIAGSDARNPQRMMPCTILERCDYSRFEGLKDPEGIRDYIFDRIKRGHAKIDTKAVHLRHFIPDYAIHFVSAASKDPAGTIRSFAMNRMRGLKSHFSKYHLQNRVFRKIK